MSESERYMQAMMAHNVDICVEIENKFGLCGYPPEIVSVALKAFDNKELVSRAQELFKSRHMRKQWIAKTVLLQESGKHLLINGKFPQKH